MRVLVFIVLPCSFLTFCAIVNGVDRSSDRVSTKIYRKIGGAVACFRRMNGTHSIGCQSSMNGDVGVVHLVNETQENHDVDWISNSGPHSPYIAVLYPRSFRADILDRLSTSGRVNGILLLYKNDTEEFSTDKSCPNRGYGFYRDSQQPNYCSKWNNQAKSNTNELLFRDWSFPIFYVPELKDIENILDCFKKFNKPLQDGNAREWPLCAAQLQSFMSAAKDTPTCLRRSEFSAFSITPRKDCDPLGNRNLVASLEVSNHTSEPYPEGSVIVIAARIDSASLFDKISPGADSAGTGVTAVLAILKQLTSIKEKLFDGRSEKKIKNVYFILFNGEAFDYIGSSRVIYDMAHNNFPFQIKDDGNDTFQPALLGIGNIKYFIELNQVANHSSGPYYIHQNLEVMDEEKQKLVDMIKSTGQNYSVKIEPVSKTHNWMGVPPSSLQSFLGNNSQFPGIVITNHHDEYENKFYNSVFDDEMNIPFDETVQSIAGLAATIARVVEILISGNGISTIEKDTQTVEDILQCYVKNGKCELFQTVTAPELVPHLRQKPLYYVGVESSSYDLLQVTSITKNVMIYYQGDRDFEERNQSECHVDSKTKNIEYIYLNGSCYRTTVVATEAVSPAFKIQDYDWQSGQYSSWTESVWTKMSVRIFLKPSFTHELITLISGILVFGISFIFVGWISAKTDVIFPTRPEQIC